MFDYIKNVILEAGEIFLEGFYSKKEISLKGKKDLVTQYDIKIENFLKEKLKSLNYDFIAEESAISGKFEKSIIIDPIDGTTNFAHKIPHCAISVGVYENLKPKMAFVYNPVMKEFYWAKKGEGAYLNDKKIRVSNEENFQRALISTGFPYSSAENEDDLKWVVEKIKKVLPRCQDIRRFGSASLDLCYVASGVIDGYYEINLKPWDVAAGILIVEEAGGVVTNSMDYKYDMFEDKCIVATNGLIHEYLVEHLN
jgi:myo-inositol-1(or 4)-monophosphatase